MKLTRIALFLALAVSGSAALAAVPSNSFDVYSNGKKIAVATFSFEKSNGIKVRCSINYAPVELATGVGKMQAHGVIDSYRIGANGNVIDASLVNSLDSSNTLYTPSRNNDSMDISIMRNSRPAGKRTIPLAQPDTLIAFPDDPSDWQTLIAVTTAHPHDNRQYNLFIPTTVLGVTDRMEPFLIKAPIDADGTLDGAPVKLKHYVLRFNAGPSDIYTDADGNLMQAEIAPLKIKQVHTGFVLTQ